jgi:mycolic acid cyclopropane synthetase
MEAGLWRIYNRSAFPNIRFDYNAVAGPFGRHYRWNWRWAGPVIGSATSVTAGSFHWCFDGSFVAFRSPELHPPRYDDLHHGARDDFHLRGRHGSAGQGALHNRAGLLVCDIEILRLHYADTLKAWRERFIARREEAVRLYDERFARMWEFYLACSEMAFRKQNLMVMQIQLTKRQGVVPMSRDYIANEEARLRGKERRTRPQLQVAGE